MSAGLGQLFLHLAQGLPLSIFPEVLARTEVDLVLSYCHATLSDATLLPSGELLLLERKFSWLGGVGIRIRRIPLGSVVPGALVDGPSIFFADLGYEIDNMEGIDAHVTPEGDTVITMISDDNFSLIQRNLLLQFTLVK